METWQIYSLVGLALITVVLNIYSTVRAKQYNLYSSKEGKSLVYLIWLVPAFGAIISLYIINQDTEYLFISKEYKKINSATPGMGGCGGTGKSEGSCGGGCGD